MAPTETTTIRVPIALRDEIARLAQARRTTMLDIVADAIRRLSRDQWWETVRYALDEMTEDDVESYRAEAERLDSVAVDGLRGG